MMMKVDMWTTAEKHYGMNNMWEIILIGCIAMIGGLMHDYAMILVLTLPKTE
jgi:hypothetical protein